MTTNLRKFSKSKTDQAGVVLCSENSSKEEKNKALEVLSNWRASHSYPMDVFKQRLKRVSEKIDKNSSSSCYSPKHLFMLFNILI